MASRVCELFCASSSSSDGRYIDISDILRYRYRIVSMSFVSRNRYCGHVHLLMIINLKFIIIITFI